MADDEDSTQDCVLMKKPNTTSKVWVHFGLKGDEDGAPFQRKSTNQSAAIVTRLS